MSSPHDAPLPRHALDPVCGVTLTPDPRTARVLFRGAWFYFCSSGCRLGFKRAPERHAEVAGAAVPVGPAVPPATRPPSPFRVRGGARPSGSAEDDDGRD